MAKRRKNNTDNTNKPTPLTALFVAAAGLYPIAIGLKILPVPAHSLHAPHWVMTAIGCAVLFAGIAIGLQCLRLATSFLYKFVAAIILLALLTPVAWLVFGDSTFPLLLRIAFASPFVIIALIFQANHENYESKKRKRSNES